MKAIAHKVSMGAFLALIASSGCFGMGSRAPKRNTPSAASVLSEAQLNQLLNKGLKNQPNLAVLRSEILRLENKYQALKQIDDAYVSSNLADIKKDYERLALINKKMQGGGAVSKDAERAYDMVTDKFKNSKNADLRSMMADVNNALKKPTQESTMFGNMFKEEPTKPSKPVTPSTSGSSTTGSTPLSLKAPAKPVLTLSPTSTSDDMFNQFKAFFTYYKSEGKSPDEVIKILNDYAQLNDLSKSLTQAQFIEQQKAGTKAFVMVFVPELVAAANTALKNEAFYKKDAAGEAVRAEFFTKIASLKKNSLIEIFFEFVADDSSLSQERINFLLDAWGKYESSMAPAPSVSPVSSSSTSNSTSSISSTSTPTLTLKALSDGGEKFENELRAFVGYMKEQGSDFRGLLAELRKRLSGELKSAWESLSGPQKKDVTARINKVLINLYYPDFVRKVEADVFDQDSEAGRKARAEVFEFIDNDAPKDRFGLKDYIIDNAPFKHHKFTSVDDKEKYYKESYEEYKKGVSPVSSSSSTSAPLSTFGLHLDVGEDHAIGRRPRMEDASVIDIREDQKRAFFGVFDGHGGDEVANSLADKSKGIAHAFFAEKIDPSDASAVQKFFVRYDESNFKNSVRAGSTAVVFILDKNNGYFVNLGDSEGFLVRGGKVVAQTMPHKPENERARIEAAGGKVSQAFDSSTGTHYGPMRVNGSLAVSRAFGDYSFKDTAFKKGDGSPKYKDLLVSNIPDVTALGEINSGDVIILVCDGITEPSSVTPEKIVSTQANEETAEHAARALVKLAHKEYSQDNMSAMVIRVK